MTAEALRSIVIMFSTTYPSSVEYFLVHSQGPTRTPYSGREKGSTLLYFDTHMRNERSLSLQERIMKKVNFTLLALLSIFFIACNKPSGQDADVDSNAVDLGLSVKWAKCNIGASNPEDYGDYYAWGDLKPYDEYVRPLDLSTCNTDSKYDLDEKYRNMTDEDIINAGINLVPDDDIAHIKLGGKWRMPTAKEFQELIKTKNSNDYRWEWKTINGHSGFEITWLKNNNSIFLPAAGGYYGSCDEKGKLMTDYAGSLIVYWSSTAGLDRFAYYFQADNLGSEAPVEFYSHGVWLTAYGRYYGLSIRPVTE